MTNTVNLISVAILSVVCTLLVVNHVSTPSDRLTTHQFNTTPRHYSAFPKERPSVFTPPRSVRSHPTIARRPASPISAASLSMPTVREEGKDCSSDFMACGEGFYCCSGVCLKSVEVDLSFIADDRGDLFVCQQKGYNSVASTGSYDQIGTYKGPLPCTETYIKASNVQYEGGATLVIEAGGKTYSSGTDSLPLVSQTDFSGDFTPVVLFDALDKVPPYSEFIEKFGAFPVKDSQNSEASVTNFRFIPPGCESEPETSEVSDEGESSEDEGSAFPIRAAIRSA